MLLSVAGAYTDIPAEDLRNAQKLEPHILQLEYLCPCLAWFYSRAQSEELDGLRLLAHWQAIEPAGDSNR